MIAHPKPLEATGIMSANYSPVADPGESLVLFLPLFLASLESFGIFFKDKSIDSKKNIKEVEDKNLVIRGLALCSSG